MAANLTLDILNKLRTEFSFEELELIRLAQDPNMVYRKKIEEISETLKNMANLEKQIEIANKYFNTQPSQPIQQIQTQVHQGQTHGE